MGKIILLDCTLRDGGYVNDWQFGEDAIIGVGKKIAQTGVEMFEIGFIKGSEFSSNRAVFPNIESISEMISPKDPNMMYVGMIDLGDVVPIENICPYDGSSVDGLRIIFKKGKIKEAYDYCKKIQELGYKLFVQFVGTDSYTDKEFIEAIELFNNLDPYAVSIVDSFGLMKRKQFLRFVHLADNNLKPKIILGYHAHNNLQQAFGNAEALVDLNLKRDLCIDACVFGMGRGAGNLNLELFADYLNENFGTSYRIEPMLEIMDEYLQDIYKERFWGYSLPFYLSATTGCHPNYAIYLAEKDSLTVKSFNELLRNIPEDKKAAFSKSNAEEFYYEYQQNFIEDRESLAELSQNMHNRIILLLAPGKSLAQYKDQIVNFIKSKNPIIISSNFISDEFGCDYVFSSNMRRYSKLAERTDIKRIITSNIKETNNFNYKVNYSSFSSIHSDIVDNSGVMLLKLLLEVGVKEVDIAGMDGYTNEIIGNYFDKGLDYNFSNESEKRNSLISRELKETMKKIKINFITPTLYEI
jgi:4-hydroxy 2-oxovalerate aldolase